MEKNPLSMSEKLSYSFGRFGSSITMDLANLFTGFVYYLFFGLKEDPFLAFFALAIGKVVIGFTCFFSGYISDKTKTRIGRRKPFILIGAPLLAISFFLLYNPHLIIPSVTDSSMIFGYLVLWNSIYQASYGFLITPYQSLLPEITSEKERLQVSGFQNMFNTMAFIVGAGVSFLLPILLNTEEDRTYSLADLELPNNMISSLTNGQILTIIITLFSITCFLAYLPTLFKVKESDVFVPQPPLREELKIITSNRNFMSWVTARTVIEIAIMGLVGIMLAWIEEVLLFDTVGYLIFGGTLLTTMFFGFYFWVKYGNRIGKTKSFIYSMLLLALIMPLMSVIGQLEILNIVPLILQTLPFVAAAAFCLASYYLLPYAITGDIAEEDERRTGIRRAGSYNGFELLIMNVLGQVLGFLLVGFILELDPITNYAGNTFSIGYLLFGPICSVIIIASVILFWKFVNADPLNTE